MNYIFEMKLCMVMITENILLKFKIIPMEKNGNSITFTQKYGLIYIRVYENNKNVPFVRSTQT